MLQSLEKLFSLDRIAQMFHEHVQDDKRPALISLCRLMEAAGAQYVIAGGLATQLHVSDPRFTGDVDVVARTEDGSRIVEMMKRAPFSEEFELAGQRRHWIHARHRSSGTPIDVNTSPLFARVLVDSVTVEVEGCTLPIACALAVAYTKLRTQQPRWPRQPGKRLIDRADLMQLLQDNPGLYEKLRTVTEEAMYERLDTIYAESQVTVEPYPDFEEGGTSPH